MIVVLCGLLLGALVANQHYRDNTHVRAGLAVFGSAVIGHLLWMLWKRRGDPTA